MQAAELARLGAEEVALAVAGREEDTRRLAGGDLLQRADEGLLGAEGADARRRVARAGHGVAEVDLGDVLEELEHRALLTGVHDDDVDEPLLGDAQVAHALLDGRDVGEVVLDDLQPRRSGGAGAQQELARARLGARADRGPGLFGQAEEELRDDRLVEDVQEVDGRRVERSVLRGGEVEARVQSGPLGQPGQQRRGDDGQARGQEHLEADEYARPGPRAPAGVGHRALRARPVRGSLAHRHLRVSTRRTARKANSDVQARKNST